MRKSVVISACLLGIAAVAVLWPGRTRIPDPLESRIDLIALQIYDAAQWARRLPTEIALPVIARSKIRSFLSELDLEPAVRERVLARLDSRAFVDEVIPFGLALRDVYMESEEWAPESFDHWLRRSFERGENIPGFEHSMFAWDATDSAADLPAFDDDLIAMMVAFYDSLYLQAADPDDHLEDLLACERRDSDEARAPAAERVRPVVRELLVDVRARVQEDGEIGTALDGILRDPVKLQAVSISLVHFLDELVCSHYRIFATRVLREKQLQLWMQGELDRADGGLLWSYLDWAQNRRRYAALLVVDGLQGHLVESLASGAAGKDFLEQVRREQDRGAAAPLPAGAKRAPAQRTEFLSRLVGDGFRDDRYMSFFGRLYANPDGIARCGVSTTPTISVRNIPMALTGAPVAGDGATGLPNFHFVERDHRVDGEPQGRAYYFFGSDAVLLPDLVEEAGMQTLFERLPQQGSMSCSAQYDEQAQFGIDALLNLALGESLRDLGERLLRR